MMPRLRLMDCSVCGYVHEGASNCPACGSEPIQTDSLIDSIGVSKPNDEGNEKSEENSPNGVNTEVSKDDAKVIETRPKLSFGIGDAPVEEYAELEIFGLGHAPLVDLESSDSE